MSRKFQVGSQRGSSRQYQFNHGFLGRTKKFQVATHLTTQTSYLATRTWLDEFIGVDGTVERLLLWGEFDPSVLEQCS
ncbi:MAG: hypothetical protein NZ820_10430, partial [Dehalococcoidia bacterium]|nr:hypothetical protein [Dehalococcoidia bacterium]